MSDPARFYYRDPEAPLPQRRQVGALALIGKGDRVLLERRSDSGLWGFVGGRVNEDETVEAALRREVHEETGLRLNRIDLFGVFSDPTRIIAYGDGNVVRLLTLVFRSTVSDTAEPRPSGVAGAPFLLSRGVGDPRARRDPSTDPRLVPSGFATGRDRIARAGELATIDRGHAPTPGVARARPRMTPRLGSAPSEPRPLADLVGRSFACYPG